MKELKLIECPRDAMQGWKHFIPTDQKIEYLNQLLKVGFDTLDFGSFVSEKAIPQMKDTREVITHLETHDSLTRLLAIIANLRGAEKAIEYNSIHYLGFPFSISPTFQYRNTHSTIEQSFDTVQQIQTVCTKNGKELVVYISMAFGNPYGDLYSDEMVIEWIQKIGDLGINIVSLADTVGLASPAQIALLTQKVKSKFPDIEIGIHLHSTQIHWKQKVDAALDQGCLRFDGALKGIGGCPMANDELVGNMDTELMIPYFQDMGYLKKINAVELNKALLMAGKIFTP